MRTFATKPRAPSDSTPVALAARGESAVRHREKLSFGRRLVVDPAGEEQEREANRLSEQVMHPPDPGSARLEDRNLNQVHRRKAGSGGASLPAMRAELPRWEAAELPPVVAAVLRSPGRSLDPAARAFAEPRLGYDFSQIRVHTDAKAAESAHAINALAFTAGRHLVFGEGQYRPGTASGRRLLAHELVHSIQQGLGTPRTASTGDRHVLQRQPAPPDGTKEEPAMRVHSAGGPAYGLRNKLHALMDANDTAYMNYRDAITRATPAEKQFALSRTDLLFALSKTLDSLSFARCVEALGRRAPDFDELRKNKVVSDAITAAWQASNVGMSNTVGQGHEEGGWVFMNLIDGSLSVEAVPHLNPVTNELNKGTDFLRVDPVTAEVPNGVLVAIFHTHPHLGKPAPPSRIDLREDKRRGVPNLVVGNTGNRSDIFQVRLSGPRVRKHLASDTKIPGASGGIAP